jgi:hypothetical protein
VGIEPTSPRTSRGDHGFEVRKDHQILSASVKVNILDIPDFATFLFNLLDLTEPRRFFTKSCYGLGSIFLNRGIVNRNFFAPLISRVTDL